MKYRKYRRIKENSGKRNIKDLKDIMHRGQHIFGGHPGLDWILPVFTIYAQPLRGCSNVKTGKNVVLKVCADYFMNNHDLMHAPSSNTASVVSRGAIQRVTRLGALNGAA